MKLLEQQLGVRLFRREGRQLSLTLEGEQLYQSAGTALRMLRDARRHLGRRQDTRRLNLRVAPSFGVRWLGPRLSRFVARHPDWFPDVKAHPMSPSPVGKVGGIGGMMRFSPFGGAKDKVGKCLRACYDEGVILFSCGHGPYHVRMLPPLGVMKLEDWPRVFAAVERGLAKVAG